MPLMAFLNEASPHPSNHLTGFCCSLCESAVHAKNVADFFPLEDVRMLSSSELEESKSNASQSQFLSTAGAAKVLGLSTTLVQTLVDQGELKGWKTRGGHRRIAFNSISEYQSHVHIALHRKVKTETRQHISVMVENSEWVPSFKNDLAQWQLPIDVSFFESVTEAILDLSTNHPDMLVMELSAPLVQQEKTLQALENFNKRGKSPLPVVIVTQEKSLLSSVSYPTASTVQLVAGPISPIWLHAYLSGIVASSRL
jgi:excisionase family DNA binding protein